MKKNFRIVLALVLSIMMVLSSMPVLAAVEPANVSTAGSITISSPVMGAKYTGYQVFEMTANADYDALSYTIKTVSKFYDAVRAYATKDGNYDANETGIFKDGTAKKNLPKSGLILTASASDPTLFNVSVTEDFDAQAFGQYLQTAVNGGVAENLSADPPVVGIPAVNEPKVYYPTVGYHGATPTNMAHPTEADSSIEPDAVTVATSTSVKFTELPLGYYLILSEYRELEPATVKLKLHPDEADDAVGNKVWTITKEMIDDEDATNSDGQTLQQVLNDYIRQKVTDGFVAAYIAANPEKVHGTSTEVEGGITADDIADVKAQLQASYREDAEQKIRNAFVGPESDDNALTSRLVFIDSTTPHADIIEKNEYHRWDIPVNPEGDANLKPYDEPEGGKNIVIREGVWNTNEKKWNVTPVYAHATESNIGEKVHYQLSVNAVNFERNNVESIDGDTTTESVKQVKEYIIADYENKNMTYVAPAVVNSADYAKAEGIWVSIVKKNADGTVQIIEDKVNYSQWADKFFHNDNKTDLGKTDDKYNTLFATDGEGGMVIPWVKLLDPTSDADKDLFDTDGTLKDMTNVSTTVKPDKTKPAYLKGTELTPKQEAAGWKLGTGDDVGYILDKDGQKIPLKDANGDPAYETTTYYWKSLYPNDVTILVDYWMTLEDTAIIDEPGNINISQYGTRYVKPDDYSYTPPKPEDDTKPDKEKDHSDAKVYTYALAFHKVDEDWKDLDGAKFKIKGLEVTKVQNGWYKVKKLTTTGDSDDLWDSATEMTTDENGWIVIEGLMTSQRVEIQETQAPDGYNKLAGNLFASPIKIGETVTTKSVVKTKNNQGTVTQTVVTETVDSSLQDGTVKSIKVSTYAGDPDTDTTLVPTVTYTVDTTDVDNELTLDAKLKKDGVSFKIVNNKGAELPSTGGMGTTIFYVGGSLMVLAAAILLITKRRMGAED